MAAPAMTMLRPAAHADHAFLLDVRKQGLRDDVIRVWGAWENERQSRYVRRLLSGDDLRIVCCNGEDGGMLTVKTTAESLHIENIFLLPAFKGMGIGTELIQDVCDRGRELGLPVTLHVLRASRARSLYERLSFCIVGETRTHFRM